MQKQRRLPAIWLMGLTNVPFGLTGGFCAVIIPQLLAAHGMPAGHVAAIASAILSPGFWIFLVSPLLDAWLSRRTYALIFGSFTAVAVALTVVNAGHPGLVEAIMIPGFASAMLYQGAVGGSCNSWMAAATIGVDSPAPFSQTPPSASQPASFSAGCLPDGALPRRQSYSLSLPSLKTPIECSPDRHPRRTRFAFHSSAVFQSCVLKQGCSTMWG